MSKHNYGSVITLRECIASIFSSVYDSNQEVGYHQLGGAVVSYDSVIHIHSSEFKNNHYGNGTILCGRSLLTFYEVCTITDNHAAVGGAINGDNVQSFIAHGATVIIANNSASSDGGGIYLSDHSNLTLYSHSVLRILKNNASINGGGIYLGYHSNLTLYTQSMLQILENRAAEGGGGIYTSELSLINVVANLPSNDTNPAIYFYKNKASSGGGLYLAIDSLTMVYTVMCHNTIFFHENSADYGGAVYVSSIKDRHPSVSPISK